MNHFTFKFIPLLLVSSFQFLGCSKEEKNENVSSDTAAVNSTPNIDYSYPTSTPTTNAADPNGCSPEDWSGDCVQGIEVGTQVCAGVTKPVTRTCGNGIFSTATPTSTFTPTNTPTNTPTSTATNTPSPTKTPLPYSTIKGPSTPTPTSTPSSVGIKTITKQFFDFSQGTSTNVFSIASNGDCQFQEFTMLNERERNAFKSKSCQGEVALCVRANKETSTYNNKDYAAVPVYSQEVPGVTKNSRGIIFYGYEKGILQPSTKPIKGYVFEICLTKSQKFVIANTTGSTSKLEVLPSWDQGKYKYSFGHVCSKTNGSAGTLKFLCQDETKTFSKKLNLRLTLIKKNSPTSPAPTQVIIKGPGETGPAPELAFLSLMDLTRGSDNFSYDCESSLSANNPVWNWQIGRQNGKAICANWNIAERRKNLSCKSAALTFYGPQGEMWCLEDHPSFNFYKAVRPTNPNFVGTM
ncbi:MAG: hypothetical protein QE271_14495 [Bacteriovoracaceae bacterium]|nr:hypothetical protein [Bacteriovoracaceae bacterium]